MSNSNKNDKLLCAGLNTYQDFRGLERCVASIINHVDKIFVIDGRYPSWGSADLPEYSTDETAIFCGALAPKVQYHKLFAEQIVKRSRYLELAKGYQFLLVIDADDYVVKEKTDWDMFKNQLQDYSRFEHALKASNQYAHNILYEYEPDKLTSFGKLFYKPSELYYKSHWRICRVADNVETRYQDMGDPNVVQGMIMSGDDNKRLDPLVRLEADVNYQWRLEYLEGDLTLEQYNDPTLKQKFLQHQIHEMQIWQNLKQYQKDTTTS
jgi:hypothetical protein